MLEKNTIPEQQIQTELEQALQQVRQLQLENAELLKQFQNTKKSLQRTEDTLQRTLVQKDFVEANYNMIVNSRGYRLLKKYYYLRENGLIQTLKQIFSKKPEPGEMDMYACYQKIQFCERIDILTVPHTDYIAKLLQSILVNAGIPCDIHHQEPAIFEDIPYIIICPQNFKRFPNLYVAFQMEQTVSQRWLTDEYMQSLYNAYAVFDYSLVNIDYFSKDPKLAKKLYYLPVDLCKEMAERNCTFSEKTYDVVFYGAPYIEHRQAFLQPISEKYNTLIISDLFGEALYEELKKAKIVINIHYYENALLETTRLYEVLSVTDAMIISERSTDPNEEARLEGIVDFVDIGDVEGMMARIDYWLSHEEKRKEHTQRNSKLLMTRPNAAEFYLKRFLLANDRISFDQFYDEVGDFVNITGDRLCLSLPETTERRAAFDKDNLYGFEVFPGLKHHLGWIGCGMSYKFIFKKVMEMGLETVLICEDDTYFPPDFEERFAKVLAYTSAHDDWNVFNGIVADIGDGKILGYVEENGENFIYIDRMISMVFNLYHKSIFKSMAGWDNTIHNVETNTIDRYLQAKPRRVLTTEPFVVGHKEDLHSTLWGAQNTIYTELIANSSKQLHEMAQKFIAENK